MITTVLFTHILFVISCAFFAVIYTAFLPNGLTFANITLGIALGVLFGGSLIQLDRFLKKVDLRTFNTIALGLICGCLMGQALLFTLTIILESTAASSALSPHSIHLIKISLFLFSLYTGTLLTVRASEELCLSIPFIKFSALNSKKKDFLIDVSALYDIRIIDLAASGILDRRLIFPRFILKELLAQVEAPDEQVRSKAKRALDVIKRLESLPELAIHYHDTDIPDIKDGLSKTTRLARLIDANVLMADASQVRTPSLENVRFINIHELSKALKPIMHTGEQIKIKIQRYGKEPRQGVGYLEDGTMVVVNGGGDSLGETIDVQVLSVKHTTAGRMIFCNTLENRADGFPSMQFQDEFSYQHTADHEEQ